MEVLGSGQWMEMMRWRQSGILMSSTAPGVLMVKNHEGELLGNDIVEGQNQIQVLEEGWRT